MSMPRLLAWLLGASMLVNVFLAAAFLTHSWQRGGPPPPGGMVEHMARDLDPADAAILRRVFAENGPRMDEIHRLKGLHFEQLRIALEAQPFDPQAVRAAFAQGDRFHIQMGQVLGDSIAQAAEQMSAQGRQRLARFKPPPPPR